MQQKTSSLTTYHHVFIAAAALSCDDNEQTRVTRTFRPSDVTTRQLLTRSGVATPLDVTLLSTQVQTLQVYDNVYFTFEFGSDSENHLSGIQLRIEYAAVILFTIQRSDGTSSRKTVSTLFYQSILS